MIKIRIHPSRKSDSLKKKEKNSCRRGRRGTEAKKSSTELKPRYALRNELCVCVSL